MSSHRKSCNFSSGSLIMDCSAVQRNDQKKSVELFADNIFCSYQTLVVFCAVINVKCTLKKSVYIVLHFDQNLNVIMFVFVLYSDLMILWMKVQKPRCPTPGISPVNPSEES